MSVDLRCDGCGRIADPDEQETSYDERDDTLWFHVEVWFALDGWRVIDGGLCCRDCASKKEGLL